MKLHSRLIATVATTSVLALGLSACGGDSDSEKTSKESTSSQESEKDTSKDAEKDAEKDADKDAGKEENAALTALTTQAQTETDAIFEQQLKEFYKEVSIEPEPPSTVVFRYVYKAEVDAKEAKSKLDAESDALEKTAVETVIPGMDQAGVPDGIVKYVYENPDGTVLWEKTYSAKK